MRTKTEIFGEIAMAHIERKGSISFEEARMLQQLADVLLENEQLKEHIAIPDKEKESLSKELEELKQYKIDTEHAIKNVWIPYRDAWFAVYGAIPRNFFPNNTTMSGQNFAVHCIKTMAKKIQEYEKRNG